MSYTLKLDLTEYQRNALVTALRSGVDEAEGRGVGDAPYPTALGEVLEQITGYAEAVELAKRITEAEVEAGR